MIIPRENFTMSASDIQGIAEGFRYVALIFMLIFLVNILINFLSDGDMGEIPIKSYLAYFVMYFFYRMSII